MNIPEFFTSVHRFSKYALEKVFKKRLSQNYKGIFHLLLTFFTVPFCCVFFRTFFSSAASNFFLHPELQKLQFFCSPFTYRLELLQNF
ncbi:MAG: hypothetical protein C6W58_14585 [Bacillaceae bacterium]|nr:MAG: hypothetical protein C6W58_14585 [Bacillaceae bacterium]